MIVLLLVSALCAEPLRVAVEGIALESEGPWGVVRSGETLRRVEGTLAQGRVPVAVRKSSYFDHDPPETPLRLGLHILETTCQPLAEDVWMCRMKTSWELYHRPSDTLVYVGTFVSVGKGAEQDEAAVQAILEAARSCARRDHFQKRLDSDFYPPIRDADDLRTCAESDPKTARWQAQSPNLTGWALDTAGQVLVPGATSDTLPLRWGDGPWLDATRISDVAPDAAFKGGLYHVPVHEAPGCVADDFAIPAPPGASPVLVGTALQQLGLKRLAQERPLMRIERPDLRHEGAE